jgi:hypothetical protein
MKTARKHHCVLHERNSSQQTLLPGHSWRRRLWLGVRATELATGARSPGARGTAARHCRGRSYPTPQGWTLPLAGQGQRSRRPLDLARPRPGGPSLPAVCAARPRRRSAPSAGGALPWPARCAGQGRWREGRREGVLGTTTEVARCVVSGKERKRNEPVLVKSGRWVIL